MGRTRRWLVGGAVLAALVLMSGYWWYEPGWRYEVRGVDVSHHQGTVDWELLGNEGTDFAYLKATEGGDWVDPRFDENWRGAHDAGVLVGGYHFFTLCAPGELQAANFIAHVPAVPGTLPPAVDVEFAGNCAARPDVPTFRREFDAYIAAVEAHYGVEVVVYVLPDFYAHYLAEDPPDVTWWAMAPVLEPWGAPEWTFWQHFPGSRAGVGGRIDRNIFRGSMADLEAMLQR